MKALFITMFLMLTLTACSTSGYYQTTQSSALSAEQADIISKDISAQLADNFAPAHTTFLLSEQHTFFGVSLEKSLRQSGFAIQSDPNNNNGVRLGYVIDNVAPEQIVVRVVAGEHLQFNRLYKRESDSVIPASTFSVRGGVS